MGGCLFGLLGKKGTGMINAESGGQKFGCNNQASCSVIREGNYVENACFFVGNVLSSMFPAEPQDL